MAGDVLVAVIDMRGNLNHKINPPLGWTLVRRDSMEDALTKAIYVRKARSTDPESYTFDFSRTQRVNGIIVAFSGVSGRNPVVASSGTATGDSASIHASAVSAPEGGYLVGLFATIKKATVAPPSAMTERLDLTQSSANYFLTSEIATAVVSSGDTGRRTAEATTAANNIGQLLLLRPKE